MLEEKEHLHKQVEELKRRISQLEETDKVRSRNYALLEQSEKLRGADFERLKKENAILNRRFQKNNDNESEFVKLLKDQVGSSSHV